MTDTFDVDEIGEDWIIFRFVSCNEVGLFQQDDACRSEAFTNVGVLVGFAPGEGLIEIGKDGDRAPRQVIVAIVVGAFDQCNLLLCGRIHGNRFSLETIIIISFIHTSIFFFFAFLHFADNAKKNKNQKKKTTHFYLASNEIGFKNSQILEISRTQ